MAESDGHISRLDAKLAADFPEHSRATWQKYIKAGFVRVNGDIIVVPKHKVDNSDNIQTDLPLASDFSSQTLPIIYTDDNVVVIDKPVGVLTHAKGVSADEFTVADFLQRFITDMPVSNRAGIVHRLDRGTSGVIIGARNMATQKLLQKQFASRKTKKTYIAIIQGQPKNESALVDLPIARNPSRPSSFKVAAGGKPAQTNYEVLASTGRLSLLKLSPRTGRTHQLRVHLQYIGTPILGDTLYGGNPSDRVYLHARSLEITIPGPDTNLRRTFEAPLPQEFMDLFPAEGTKCQ